MLSQTSEYALRAMACMAMRPEENYTAGSLARQTQVPQDYLAKVLQQLAGAGLITGRRGVGGGYTLARRPETISLSEVINSVATLQRIKGCPLGLTEHASGLCPLHKTVDAAIEAALAVFSDKTLADLFAHPNHDGALCRGEALLRPTIAGARVK